MEFFSELSAWHWLSLGIVLLVLDVLGAAGFLLGLGLGAIVVAAVLALLPNLDWQWQLVLFAVFSVLFTWLYWSRFRAVNEATDQPKLNDRTANLIGSSAELLDDSVGGRGQVQIADALWTVTSEEDLPKGTLVEIVAAEGMVLQVIAKA